MSPNASHRVRPGLSSAASLITTLLISFDQEVLNQHLNLVTPEYPFFESPWAPPPLSARPWLKTARPAGLVAQLGSAAAIRRRVRSTAWRARGGGGGGARGHFG